MLTEDERFTLNHWMRWGSDGYPITKRGRSWHVEGIRSCGSCPKVFRTKTQAQSQWEAYIHALIEKQKK